MVKFDLLGKSYDFPVQDAIQFVTEKRAQQISLIFTNVILTRTISTNNASVTDYAKWIGTGSFTTEEFLKMINGPKGLSNKNYDKYLGKWFLKKITS